MRCLKQLSNSRLPNSRSPCAPQLSCGTGQPSRTECLSRSGVALAGLGSRTCSDWPDRARRRAAQAVFHAERGLEWVVFAQQHQHAVVTALANWSCATVTVTFYATFLPILVCEPQLTLGPPRTPIPQP